MTAILANTALDIVNKAFSILRVRDREHDLDANDREAGFQALNYWIKYLQTQGFHLWTKTEAVLPLVKNKSKYTLGLNGDYCFKDDDFNLATLSADALLYDVTLTSVVNLSAAPNIINYNATTSTSGWTATDGTLSVDSGLVITNTAIGGYTEYPLETTIGNEYIIKFSVLQGSSCNITLSAVDSGGEIIATTLYCSGSGELRFTARQSTTQFTFTNNAGIGTDTTLTAVNYIDTNTGDYIAVILDNGDIQWSRVNYLDGLVATMKDTVLSSATSGNYVYYASTIIDRPLSITQARYQGRPNYTEIPCLEEWARSDYFDQPDKTSQGLATQWYYDPQLTAGALYVWQVAQSNQEFLKFTYIRPTDINENNADSPDFPSEWFLVIAMNVADNLTAEYSVPDQRSQVIKTQAAEMLANALGNDNDDTYLQITPGRR